MIIPTLTAGGAQRIMTFLAKNLNNAEFDSQLVVIGYRKNNAYDITNVRIKFLNKKRVLYSIPKIIAIIREERPRIVMGSIAHLNTILGLLSMFFPRVIFIGRQTNISKAINKFSPTLKKSYLNRLYSFALNRLDYIICQSSDMARDCIDHVNISEKKIVVLRNPITDNFNLKTTIKQEKKDFLNLITVGRLEEIKGYDRIIDILSQFDKSFKYTIIGSGPLKEVLQKKVASYNLQNHVEFIDYTSEVQIFLKKNDFFLQGSYSEGFPNALLESCAVGTPVIAFNCPGGTSEIVINNVNGYLVDDTNTFLSCLNKTYKFDASVVSNSVYKKFSKSIILNEYETFFKKAVKNKTN